MDGKQEAGGFLKQMQNKVKNLRRKLEKIQEKEKRPRAELSEEEKTQLESKPLTELLLSEYEKLVTSYVSARETGEVPRPEVRTEVREVDNAAEILSLWAALHFVGLPGARSLYEEQGKPRQDFEEVLTLRKQLLGRPGDSVLALYTAAMDLLPPHLKSKDDALARVTSWCLGQKLPVPPPEPVLAVHSLPHHDIIREPEPAVVPPPQPVIDTPQPASEPLVEAAKPEEVKETGKTWAEQEDDEEEAPEASTGQTKEAEDQEDAGFTVVGGKPKRKKAPTEPETRGGFAGRRRGGFRGDRRPRRGGDRG